jgi:Ca2+-binding EF-hand superfamily protein
MKYLIPAALLLAAPVLAQPPQSTDPGQAFLQTFDADRNGSVSKEEYIAPHVQQFEKQFDYMDKNKDGAVDKAEADAFAEEMQQRIQQMQQKPKE